MYKITDSLDKEGFSINVLETLINRNKGSYAFNSLEFFVIIIAVNSGSVIVDGITYVLQSNRMLFVAPHKSIVYSKECLKNIVIAFSATFYEKSAKDSYILNSDLFFNSKGDAFMAPTIGSIEEVNKLIVNRLNLYKQKEMGLYIAVAHNCVEILLLDGLLELEQQEKKPLKIHFSYIDVVNRFRVLLQKHYKSQKQVIFYSDQLNVSAQRLSIMTELVLGKGAKKIIIEKINQEAVQMLKKTGRSISEISADLGFSDEGNFSAFIKKHYGKTPREIKGVENLNE